MMLLEHFGTIVQRYEIQKSQQIMKTKLDTIKHKNEKEFSTASKSKRDANKDIHDINKSNVNVDEPQLSDETFLKKGDNTEISAHKDDKNKTTEVQEHSEIHVSQQTMTTKPYIVKCKGTKNPPSDLN